MSPVTELHLPQRFSPRSTNTRGKRSSRSVVSIRMMPEADSSVWSLLARWRARGFLVAGGLLLASPVTKGLALLADVSPPVWLLALLVFPGLLAALAGLLGMYPRLADDSSRLALAGGIATVVAGCGVTLVFGWALASSISLSLGALTITAPSGSIYLSLMALIATGFILFGLASLRASVDPRLTGFLLLAFAVPWVVILAVTPVYGSDLPEWFALAVYGVMPIVLLTTGYSVREGGSPSDSDALPGIPSAG